MIFKSKGEEIYLDQEMHARLITAEFHGRRLRLVAPEDLLIIKAAAHSELCPNHWHDADRPAFACEPGLGVSDPARAGVPRGVSLSLLLYAQSNDIWVPNYVIHELFNGVFGDAARNGELAHRNRPEAPPREVPWARVHAVSPRAMAVGAATAVAGSGRPPLPRIRHVPSARMPGRGQPHQ